MTIKELQLRSELEALTGIYADSILSDAIKCEYERKTDDGHSVWSDKQGFCAAYKENKDGLAEKIQRAANEKIWSMKKNHLDAMTVYAERAHVLSNMQQTAENRIKELEAELADREKYCEMLREDLETKHTVETLDSFASTEIRIVSALRQMIRDDFSKEEIGAAAIFADYLLTEMALTETEDKHD